MTKIDLNSATRDDLVAKAGIRPQAAAAILKYRAQHGPFAGVEQLIDVPGIGPTTFEQIKPLVIVPDAALALEAVPEQPATVIQLTEAEILPIVEHGQAVGEATIEVLEQAVDASAEAAVECAALTTRAASGVVGQEAARVTGDLAALWLSLATEQMSHGVESLKAVMAARSVPELIEAQNSFLRGSMVRFLEATNRCMRLSNDVAANFTALSTNRLDAAA